MTLVKEIVIATHNPDKKKEIMIALRELGVNILSLDSFPEIGEIEETGSTLLENSLIKARTVSAVTGKPAIADDTGLEVDALNGAPGIYSARYAGINVSYEDNVRKLLSEMSSFDMDSRTARFRTVVSFHSSNEELWTEGVIEGSITMNAIGKGGFGYDPVFRVRKTGKTFAEMTRQEKNRISHRGLALEKMCQLLKENIK
ncbi:MAG: RdgB/HAM1 family non-canonical purine NTP pyrophosphatase [Candidatus Marinimicrobia bacterium]|nr:RdgB/HAM1 family non-canonical purine NTP pyrophosphatase [Candidatus Neomarinimicrobiota bacterium]